MVATRRGANKAAEPAPAATNTLSAPPKRGGRKKAVAEEAAPAPAPAVNKSTKITKTTVAKRKAEVEPEGAELPAKKKPAAANTKATRAVKVETKVAPELKRATRGKKVAAAEPALSEEPALVVEVEEAPKRAAPRGRKAAVKKAPASAPKVEEPVVAEDEDELMMDVDEAPKPAPRGRKAAAKKPATKTVKKTPIIEELVTAEPAKPASRARKAAVPKPSLPAPAPVASTRSTRGRNVVAIPHDSPLKKPARKPVNKKAAAVIVAEAEPEAAAVEEEEEEEEEEFAEYPNYPTTPAHITARLSNITNLAVLPEYPETPAHIDARFSNITNLAALPEYPETPAHIDARLSNITNLAALPEYPKTPADIAARISNITGLAALPDYPKTPAHIKAPVLPMAADAGVKEDLAVYVNTPGQQANEVSTAVQLIESRPSAANTPARDAVTSDKVNSPEHVESVDISINSAERSFNSLFDERSPAKQVESTNVDIEEATSPAHVDATITTDVDVTMEEVPDLPMTPARIETPKSSRKALAELPVESLNTPAQVPVATPTTIDLSALGPDCFGTPAHALEAAMQEEITASVKKQTPSPEHFKFSFGSADVSACTDEDSMEVDSEMSTAEPAETSVAEPVTKLQFPPVDLSATVAAPDLASPKKSAMRSPQKLEVKTPKKAVTWHDESEEQDDDDETDLFGYNAPLRGLTFFVDVTSNGKQHNYVFASLIQDLGAKTVNDWVDGITHVLFKEGSVSTLEKVLASNGAVKCINVGWVLEVESNKALVDESPFLVDLTPAIPPSPLPVAAVNTYTPARTPSKYALPPSTGCRSIPSTPTSSEFDRSITMDAMDDDKENEDISFHYTSRIPKTCPPKKSASTLFSRSAMKTPTRANFLNGATPRQPLFTSPQTTGKKRSLESSSLGLSLASPAKKYRLF